MPAVHASLSLEFNSSETKFTECYRDIHKSVIGYSRRMDMTDIDKAQNELPNEHKSDIFSMYSMAHP